MRLEFGLGWLPHRAKGSAKAFVLAVRLALDRVRALAAAGHLQHGKPDEDDAVQILERSSPVRPIGPLSSADAQREIAMLLGAVGRTP